MLARSRDTRISRILSCEKGSTSCGRAGVNCECDRRSVQRLLRTLASTGVFVEAPTIHSPMPLGTTLRSRCARIRSRHGDFHGFTADLVGVGLARRSHTERSAPLVSDGSTAHQCMNLAEHGDLEAVFNGLTKSVQSNLHNAAIIETYDFSKTQALVDVGGGHGATVDAILARYPTMKVWCLIAGGHCHG